jgi:hypothetical protein
MVKCSGKKMNFVQRQTPAADVELHIMQTYMLQLQRDERKLSNSAMKRGTALFWAIMGPFFTGQKSTKKSGNPSMRFM